MNNLSLKGKVVIVTGGAGLLGSEFVEAIAENDGIAVIADVNEIAAKRVRATLTQRTEMGLIDSVFLDITSRDSVSDMVSRLVEKYHRIDAIVNNAYPRSENYGKKFEQVTYEDFCVDVSTHLGGYFLVSQQLALFFKEQGYGNIVNIASIYGVIAPRFSIYEGTDVTVPIQYAVTKSAIIHLTRYIAKYFKGSNIRCNSISPGGIIDSQSSRLVSNYNVYGLSKGMLNKSDVKGTLQYLLSDLSHFVNGQNIVVDDGWTL